MTTISNAEIGTGFRAYVEWWARGAYEDLEDLYEAIAEADQTGFPRQPAVEALSKLETRRLYRTFANEELQDLYDWASREGLQEAADRFADACLARPYLDDGKVPREVKLAVMARDGRRCQHCGGTGDLTIDHKIVPWVDGGSSKDPDNLQVLCRSCNSSKGARRATIDAAGR